ncbi:D-ribose-binding periplasmic protein [Beijerinckiaceae bacterium RH AL1]|jgi:ribose transport system substrate-binding protein|nr:ABC transporter substrate-binding protein [Beijerinckiaceae bacterium]VVB49505.1 D-ribose-binding periplasmic protein [Beijerinckiaceae bacterium RH CH11]VVB49585.1 D-ribose-binding periplasmic protein [Beijerinckiaceae bacterium RH AL8]VVC56937.1 D-ribose-binding periplasmic protein [Beijerinckiaceae bacterium RH AL1]
MKSVLLSTAAILALATSLAQARDLKTVGVTVGTLGNPFFIALAEGATAAAKKVNPDVKMITVSADYDLGKQSAQFDNFISSGVDLILVNAVDANAIGPAVKRAQAAGIVVVAVDTSAANVDATVQTDNIKAGEIACQYMADKIGRKGNVIIQNGPQVTAVIARVEGCEKVLKGYPDIKLLSSDQDGKGTREGGMNVMQGYLTRFDNVQGVFAINDPQAIGANLAARQLQRDNIVIVSVDGAPDIVPALKGHTQIYASASQSPRHIGGEAVELGAAILAGKKPEKKTDLIAPNLVTRDNVGEYKGW